MEFSISRYVFDLLAEAGIDTYFPEQHQGKCTAPYTVVKLGIGTRIAGRGQHPGVQNIDILCYVPEGRYDYIDSYLILVKSVLAKGAPLIKPTGVQTISFYEPNNASHMVSIQYQNYRNLNLA